MILLASVTRINLIKNLYCTIGHVTNPLLAAGETGDVRRCVIVTLILPGLLISPGRQWGL